jgi:hypothetical protein
VSGVTVRFLLQDWSRDTSSGFRQNEVEQLVAGRVAGAKVQAVDRSSLILEAPAKRATDVSAIEKALKDALPGWSVYRQSGYSLIR